MSVPKPTIVFIPGLWEGPTVFSACRSELSDLGYPTAALPLLSTNSPSPNSPTMDDDTQSLSLALSNIIDSGDGVPIEVLLVLHSAGGFLGSAAMKGLSEKERKEGGLKGGVKGILFLCAGVAPEGYLHEDRPFMDFRPEGDKMYCVSARQTLFSDLSDAEYSSLDPSVTQGFQPGSSGGWNSTTTHAGWKDVPSVYLVTDGDKVLPPAVQEHMATSLGEQCKKIERTECGHMVMLKEPKRVVQLIAELQKLVGA